MLTLAAVAVFPIACVSYVVVHGEVGSVARENDFELRDAALAAQSRFAGLLDRRELAAVAAASSPRLQAALQRREAGTLRRFARAHNVLLRVGARTYGRAVSNAARARVELTSRGRTVGAVVAQLPLTAPTLKRVAPSEVDGVRLSFSRLGAPATSGVTLRLTPATGIRAFLPSGIGSARTAAAYHRVEEAGALALLALMLLAFLLTRPLLRALRWTEARASEARVDALTGIANRRALEESLAAEISRAQRFGHPLAVVLLDLDHFKRTNDAHGHAAGDLLLRAVARILSSAARQGDTVARLGGEELVVVLPETDPAGARRLAERLRVAIEACRVGEMRITASFGVAARVDGDRVDSLLAAADAALYTAKENGRNRVESASRDAGQTPAAVTTKSVAKPSRTPTTTSQVTSAVRP
jgi:diguanylate cyclase (GGDEF)-like protein